ncbi:MULTISPECIES: hypothetical protein [Bacillus]|nr:MULTISPECIES: hypothetical protein [Bacillus cereus group]MBJ7963041.1 hypothetical protein [Bacillus cereus]MBJ7998428.1 hypothetical protein [Bacillus cereus]
MFGYKYQVVDSEITFIYSNNKQIVEEESVTFYYGKSINTGVIEVKDSE